MLSKFKRFLASHSIIGHKESISFIIKIILIIVFVLTSYYFVKIKPVLTRKYKIAQLQAENNILKFAGRITDYYNNQGYSIRVDTVYKTIIATKKYNREIFGKKSPFTLEELLAIPALESRFNPKAVGIVGEVGLWQILDPPQYLIEIDGVKDPFDIKCNTYMGLRTLKQKYEVFGDKRIAIKGYNGLIYISDEELSQKYYIRWEKNKNILEKLRGED